jgi:hypothetical protein
VPRPTLNPPAGRLRPGPEISPAVPGGVIPHFQGGERPVPGERMAAAAQDPECGGFGVVFDNIRRQGAGGALAVQYSSNVLALGMTSISSPQKVDAGT